MESAEETDKGSKEGISKVACNEEDEDADAVHSPFVPLCLWLPFEGRPEVGEVEDDNEICDDCTSANDDDESAGCSGECEHRVQRIFGMDDYLCESGKLSISGGRREGGAGR